MKNSKNDNEIPNLNSSNIVNCIVINHKYGMM